MPFTIRSRLLLLVLSVVLPAMLGLGWLILHTHRAEQDSNERILRDTAKAVAMDMDSEIIRRVSIARLLASSRWLEGGPDLPPDALARFEQQARRPLAAMGGWVELRAAGLVLLDTREPAGSAPARRAEHTLVDEAMVRPLGGVPEHAGNAHAAIVEPVQRDGRTIFNIVVSLPTQDVQRIVDAHGLPADGIAAVYDSHRLLLARRPANAQDVGRPAPPELRTRLDQNRDGPFDAVSVDGVLTSGYVSTASPGWSAVTALPRGSLTMPLSQAVQRVVLGAVLLFVLAVAGALYVSRRIVEPVVALKQAAARLQAGERVEPRPSGIAECDEVGAALAEASASLQRIRADLERRVADAVERTRQAEQRVSQSQRIEALGRLTGGVAHDFNNLLGVISNNAHLIQRQARTPELQTSAAAILRSVDVGGRLTQHLLRFAGRRPLRPQGVELARSLPELQDLLGSVLGQRIRVTVQVARDTLPVKVDANELELALINLALNARDAMPSGGDVRLRARNARAEETAGLPPARYVIVTFSDDGIGISDDLTERVFEPFFTTKEPGRGTGLGLSQVHGFCVQAGGAARIDSTPGVGSTVSMLLPARQDGHADSVPGALGGVEAPALEGACVLLVEDNDELATATAALLAAHGAQVQCAANATKALQRLDRGTPVDLVLSDVVMPGGIDGVALARKLRRERPTLPVVLISGYNDITADVGEFVVLRKPCPQDELVQTLRRAIDRRPEDAGGASRRQ